MNDATDPVGDEPWLVSGADEQPGPTGLSSETTEVEFDGRRWEVPPEGVQPVEPPAGDPGSDPQLAAFDGVDWESWARTDPQAAGAAWQVYGDLHAAHAVTADDDLQRTQRLQAAEAELARDIDGWSPRLRADLAAYGQARGFTAGELAGIEDPREIKILHLAMVGEQALAAGRQADVFGRFRPPTQVGGRGHPGHLPNDRHSTDAWMQARRTQLRKKARP